MGVDCNDGECVHEGTSFVCNCNDGFTGEFCEEKIENFTIIYTITVLAVLVAAILLVIIAVVCVRRWCRLKKLNSLDLSVDNREASWMADYNSIGGQSDEYDYPTVPFREQQNDIGDNPGISQMYKRTSICRDSIACELCPAYNTQDSIARESCPAYDTVNIRPGRRFIDPNTSSDEDMIYSPIYENRS